MFFETNRHQQEAQRVSSSAASDVYKRQTLTPAIPATPSVIATLQYIAPMAYSNIYVSAQQQGQATISHYANSTANKTYAYILVG